MVAVQKENVLFQTHFLWPLYNYTLISRERIVTQCMQLNHLKAFSLVTSIYVVFL